MKIALLIFAVIGFSLPARAQILTNAQAVKIVVPYVTSCSTVSIGTTAVEVTGNTAVISTTYGASAVKVVNQGGSNNICCSDSPGVSCTIGDVIAASATAPFNWLSWSVSTMQKWYCVASASTSAALVCRVK